MRIFLTGGTGFLGGAFIQAALDAGHELNAIHRDIRSRECVNPRWVLADLSFVEPAAFDDCDVFVHLAAVGVSPQKADWPELFQTNVSDSVALWRAAASAGVKRFVLCGSCFEYGRSAADYDFIPTHAPLEPTTAYGASKAAATVAAAAFAAESGTNVTVLRPFQIYGPHQHADNFWPSLRRAAESGENFLMTEGDQIRDFSPVADVAAKFLAYATRTDVRPARLHVANVGSGHATTLRDFATEWWEKFGATGDLKVGALLYRPNEVMRYVPDLTESL